MELNPDSTTVIATAKLAHRGKKSIREVTLHYGIATAHTHCANYIEPSTRVRNKVMQFLQETYFYFLCLGRVYYYLYYIIILASPLKSFERITKRDHLNVTAPSSIVSLGKSSCLLSLMVSSMPGLVAFVGEDTIVVVTSELSYSLTR